VRAVYCGSGWFEIVDVIRQGLPDGVAIELWDHQIPLAKALVDADFILPSNAAISADVIAAANRLKLIQQPAVGIDGIDLAAAKERGIPVCNAPGTNHVSVAEAALFLILALARKSTLAAQKFQERTIGSPLGMELEGKTLGIIGLGQSGRKLATAATALGMTVHGTHSGSSQGEVDALLRHSDVISVHCPLNRRTRGLLNREAFAKMKDGVLLVNCARGPIIDKDALIAALDSEKVAGVALDVFWQEPWDPADPLYCRPDVVTLPHVAGSTRESFQRIADIVCTNISRVISGQAPFHEVS
jgi:phosphoglycerate dehydrogenase-like enzyme